MLVGRKIQVKGIVQGVGFRPFVYKLAELHHISGWVMNSSAGVEIHATGQATDISSFIGSLQGNPPLLSKIDSVVIQEIEPEAFSGFEILQSEALPGEFMPASPDMSICGDCLRELFVP